MNIKGKNRRDFLKYSIMGLAAGAGGSLLSSCASFDDYLFDDSNNLTESVVIVGGGIAGLYLAYKFRAKQQEFRLFEAGSYLGGRIKSAEGRDYGASTFAKKDVLLNQLVDELRIEKTSLDKDNFYLTDGMQSMVDKLKDRVIGLIPYRNFRMRWQLVEIQKNSSGYDLTFQLATGQKKVRCEKLVLALPPSQWGRVKGLLDLPEMQKAKVAHQNLIIEDVIRLILPSGAVPSGAKPILNVPFQNFDYRQISKRGRQNSPVEIDIQYPSNINFSIDYVYGEIKKKLQINYPFQKLSSEYFYRWMQASYIEGAYFKMNYTHEFDKLASFQLIGDAVALSSQHRIEGALQSAALASTAFV